MNSHQSTLPDAFLKTWTINTQILDNLVAAVQDSQLSLKLAEGEMDLAEHLCHIHSTRRWWISTIDRTRLEGTERLHVQEGENWYAVRDLALIRERLAESAKIVEQTYKDYLVSGDQTGPYEHPATFLQHMLWHEGWHIGVILTLLRVHGHELTEEWEDPNIWQLWRGVEEF